jgi:AcrR family transcriptional regulator/DNA-binding MarR family transcriptional regulator
MGLGEASSVPGPGGVAGAQRLPRRPLPSGNPQMSRRQLAEIQRSRLLAGAVSAIDEFGYARSTVSQITTRSRVSRRTFYELFGDRETCMVVLLDDILGMIEDEIRAKGLDGSGWRERVRGGLGAILSFFDREPALARICVVQALCGGPKVLERREQVLARLASVIDEGRRESARKDGRTPLFAEGLVGAAFGILYTRLRHGERGHLGALQGELMSMIVMPYLGSAAARRELTRPVRAAPPVPIGMASPHSAVRDSLRNYPPRLTFRTGRVLDGIANLPGACNREVAQHAGITDQGQISKLLARLERLGLIANFSEGQTKGKPNAWSLTPAGRQVAQSIQVHAAGVRS